MISKKNYLWQEYKLKKFYQINKFEIHISAGCNGGGIVKGTLFGELLAMSANQLKVPEIKKLFGSASRMPPEPFRKIGFKLISMIESKRAKTEI